MTMEQYDTKKMTDEQIRQAFEQCFISREGKIVLSFLKRMTLDRYLGPSATDAELRSLEGQRMLVGQILLMSIHQ